MSEQKGFSGEVNLFPLRLITYAEAVGVRGAAPLTGRSPGCCFWDPAIRPRAKKHYALHQGFRQVTLG